MRLLVTLLGITLIAASQPAYAQGFDQSHKAWDVLVKKNVVLVQGGRASQVRYAEFAKDRPIDWKYTSCSNSTLAIRR